MHDKYGAIFNAHLVSKAGSVISGKCHHVCDFILSSIYYTEPLFNDKLCKSTFIISPIFIMHPSLQYYCTLMLQYKTAIGLKTGFQKTTGPEKRLYCLYAN